MSAAQKPRKAMEITANIPPLNRKPTADMTPKELDEIRGECTNRAIAFAFEGRLGFARMYADIAQQCDRLTGTPFALSPEAWESMLNEYARRAA